MEARPNIQEYFAQVAKALNGNAIEYTPIMSIVNLKLSNGNRSQNVSGFFKQKEQDWILMLSSKVCLLDHFPNVDFKDLALRNNKMWEAKAVIHHDHLEVSAACRFKSSDFDYICNLIMDIATIADELEFKITGKDEH
ncbi:MAG: hypothetical protein EAZ57_11695 [Cytophagales bacterium]|nr:MAG: hypothetical protein EAZ67_12530 [Cytophagales bacterium]TAF59310.1 MAG: hypothetical protein EAZ57_11695 [Cytophagales bacterium]